MPKSKVTFRPAQEKDLKFLCELYQSTRRHEFEQVNWTQEQVDDFLKTQFEMQHQYYHQQWPEAHYSVIMQDRRKIGRLYKDYREDEIRVIDIALFPEHRKKGIGGKIMQDILDEAARLDKAVRIHVEKNNPAMHLYQRLGFQKIGDAEVYDLLEWQHQNIHEQKKEVCEQEEVASA